MLLQEMVSSTGTGKELPVAADLLGKPDIKTAFPNFENPSL